MMMLVACDDPSGVSRTIINGLKSIYQIPLLPPIWALWRQACSRRGPFMDFRSLLSWTKVYNAYWTNPLEPIKGPSPTVNSGVLQILGHRYQRTKVSVSDDPSPPCSMRSHHNAAVRFYGLRTQVPWTKGLRLPSSKISINLINKVHCLYPWKN